ncbi:hypothetical protein [Streptomyces sp. NPDC005890]|uniref:hypothetical protein n=1 Tax=Streptomyces sp. NPDC005890 TaxID=3154568 RepID=UPI0033F33CB8
MTLQHAASGESRDLEIYPMPGREPVQVPRYELPRGEREPDAAYQVVPDELNLAGIARQNLVTFAEPEARRLSRVRRGEHDQQGGESGNRGTRPPMRARP